LQHGGARPRPIEELIAQADKRKPISSARRHGSRKARVCTPPDQSLDAAQQTVTAIEVEIGQAR